ncbi:MAG TPA: Ig-like domain-containing protein, partial [Gemmatimonadales bacterium]|nr:Ig-like domain-containing protein [Gemmatimonadales bacterium]
TVVPVASVAVTPASATLRVGGTLQLSAVMTDSANNVLNGRTVTWSTGAAGVATVNASGLVTAVGPGSTPITATSEGKTATSIISVTLAPVATVTISPATASLRVGAKLQLSATTKDSSGNVLTGRVVTWSSNAPAVATVSTTGLVTAVAQGSASITATSEGKNATITVTVTTVPVSSVTVTPSSATLSVGATQQLSAVTKDSAGNVLSGRVVTWSSNATSVASVSTGGLVTAAAGGSATITATSEGKSGSASITVNASTGTHSGWYASPSGTSSGDGSAARPWSLQTALDGGNGRVQPGDTIWLRGGTYSGTFSSGLNGTAASWIVVRQYPGERATLDGGTTAGDVLTVNGSYTMYWGFEIMVSGTQRFGAAGTGTGLRGDGVYVNSAHDLKLINLIVHDVGHGTYLENTAHNIEIYGWIIYNGGYQDNIRSDGHGIYIKGDGIGWKVARDNVIFNQFGFGIHGYAETNTQLKQLVFDGNAVFNSGTPSSYENPNMQLGGLTIADNDTVTNNMTYYSPGVTSSGNGGVRIGYNSTANGTAVFRNNYIVGGTLTLDLGYWSNLTVQGNTIAGPSVLLVQHDGASPSTQHWSGDMHYRDPTSAAWMIGNSSFNFANWQSRAGASTDQASGTLPAAPKVFVRPNRYEAGRGTIVIYNWTLQSSVSVDLSGVVTPGNRYEVRNVQDIFGTPVVSGTYNGGMIAVPMNGVTPPQPIGGAFGSLIKTGPNFDVFIVTSAP